ncbi:hypothetical protein EO92_02720 [Methanosarcina sp. 2.H.A.1B.4]|nr:hypothetical protein EO92_02720 [Methanosarcina sp. 2.H.A.1B.4]
MRKLKSFKVAAKKETSGVLFACDRAPNSRGIGLVPLEPIGISPVSNCLKQQYGAKTNLKLNKKELKEAKNRS